DIDLGHAFACLVEGALLEVGAMAAGALTVIGRQPRPVAIVQLLGPAVAITIPTVTGELLDHAAVELLAALVHIDMEALILEQLSSGTLRLAFLQQRVESRQA